MHPLTPSSKQMSLLNTLGVDQFRRSATRISNAESNGSKDRSAIWHTALKARRFQDIIKKTNHISKFEGNSLAEDIAKPMISKVEAILFTFQTFETDDAGLRTGLRRLKRKVDIHTSEFEGGFSRNSDETPHQEIRFKRQSTMPVSGKVKREVQHKLSAVVPDDRGPPLRRQKTHVLPELMLDASETNIMELDESVELSLEFEQDRKEDPHGGYLVKSRTRHISSYNRCIILPDDPWKIRWNFFLVIVIWISSILTPLNAAFFDTSSPKDAVSSLWFFSEILIDVVFVLDIIFSFFSAYYNKVEVLVADRRSIVLGYLKSWFFIDLIAVLPIQLITHNTLSIFGKMARVPRVYKLLKTAKFMRNAKFFKSSTSIKSQLAKIANQNIQVQRLLKFSSLFVVLCHTLSCVWFLVAKLQDFSEETWVARQGYLDANIGEQYLAGLYFIVATITTVGYGDISGKNPYEQLFCVILMIIGAVSYSTAIGSFMSIMSESDKKQRRLRKRLDTLARIKGEYNMSFEQYWKFRQALYYDHQIDNTDKQQLLTELPINLRVQLSHLMYSQELEGIGFFNNKTPRFTSRVAPLLRPVNVTKGEYIYMKGDMIDGIYFIKSGRACYVEPRPQADLIFASLTTGAYFGDVDFVAATNLLEAKRNFTIKAMNDMELLVLPKEDLIQLDAQFRSQILKLFETSHSDLYRLKKLRKRGRVWLKQNENYYSHEESTVQDQDNSDCGVRQSTMKEKIDHAASQNESALRNKYKIQNFTAQIKANFQLSDCHSSFGPFDSPQRERRSSYFSGYKMKRELAFKREESRDTDTPSFNKEGRPPNQQRPRRNTVARKNVSGSHITLLQDV